MSEPTSSFSAPKGTRDILPPGSVRWQDVTRFALDSFALAGYLPVETPAFEHTEVFARGVGETSEVVTKQMYTFIDQGGRSLTLRPEATASTMRAILEHDLHRGALPVKLSYAGWMYRQERPQKGRYRQFFQLGIEAVGATGPGIDAEVIEVAMRFYAGLGLQVSLKLNSIGHPDPGCRFGYNEALVAYLRDNEDALAEEDRARIATNPLRTFDSKEEATRAVMKDAPVITDHLCSDCAAHYEGLKELLGDLDVVFEEDPRLVRGLDYYTKTAFEFVAGGLGSQDAVGGGGRYDGLAELLGGPHVPGIGFALGLDRIVLALGDGSETGAPVTAYIVALGDAARRRSHAIAKTLRDAGIGCDLDHLARGMKGQMKDADRSGATHALIIGDSELADGVATIKTLSTGEQEQVRLDELEEWFKR